ncbi:MAG: hypothetical protein B6D36_17855 [Planctomycetes bacterium UTPLA1]|nr:MAG: hypothetical protein B6D36_17855 [Planctomycetes bacterium UTPLA1]
MITKHQRNNIIGATVSDAALRVTKRFVDTVKVTIGRTTIILLFLYDPPLWRKLAIAHDGAVMKLHGVTFK